MNIQFMNNNVLGDIIKIPDYDTPPDVIIRSNRVAYTYDDYDKTHDMYIYVNVFVFYEGNFGYNLTLPK